MRKTIIYITSLILLILGLAGAVPIANAQDTDSESVIRSILGALDAGDAETAASFAADDAIIALLPGPDGKNSVVQGKEAIREWWGFIAVDNSEHKLWDFHVDGSRVSWKATVWGDLFRNLGMEAPLIADCVGIVEDGLLQSYTWKLTDDSLNRLAKATARTANATLASRYMEELWNQGNLGVADELLHEEFVSYAFPAGDRETLKNAVAGFHEANPGGHFVIDETIITGEKIILRGGAMLIPSGSEEGAKAERADTWFLVMNVKDGKIVDRWVAFVPQQEPE